MHRHFRKENCDRAILMLFSDGGCACSCNRIVQYFALFYGHVSMPRFVRAHPVHRPLFFD